MRKTLSIAAIFVIVLLTFSILAILINADPLVWSNPVQLTTDLASDHRALISQDSSGKIWILFTSDRSGTSQILYITSSDHGTTWSSPQLFPPAQVPGGAHYVAETYLFEDSTGRLWAAWGRWVGPSTEDIYFSTSDDLGATWSETQLLVSYPDVDGVPSFLEVNGEVWLVFSSWGISGNWNIYYIKTSDGGLTWSSPQGIVVSPFRHDNLGVLKDSTGKVWVVYSNLTSPYDPRTADLWYVSTVDNGQTWSTPKQITSFPSEENSLSIVESGEALYVFYMDRYNPDIWYVTSKDGGITWSSTPERIDSDSAQDQWPNAAVIGGNMWVVWHSDRAGNWDVWMSKTTHFPAAIDIDPNTLNLKSNGKFVTAYIELPDGYDVANIDLATVQLEGIPAITDTQYGFVTDPASYLMDHDGDGVLERMVKFDRNMVTDTLLGVPDYSIGIGFNSVTLTVTGNLSDGTPFEGSDNVTVIWFGI